MLQNLIVIKIFITILDGFNGEVISYNTSESILAMVIKTIRVKLKELSLVNFRLQFFN